MARSLVSGLASALPPRVRARVAEKAYTARLLVTGGAPTLAAAGRAWLPHVAVGALAGAVIVAGRGSRPLAAVLAVGGVAAAAPVLRRLGVAPTSRGADGPEVSVLSANVRHGHADTGVLAALVAGERPDFVVLPEAGGDFRDKLVPLLAGLGYRSWVASGGGRRDGDDVTLLVADRAGDVRVRPGTGMRLPHLEVSGGILGPRTLYAVHPTAPMSRRGTARWHDDLALVGRWTAGPVAPLVAGDLNATLDHPALRAALGRCRTACAGNGHELVGTFPAGFPRWLGIQIDHVLVPADAVTTRFAVLDVAGTDHRAVLAGMRLPQAG